jgi:hypothetical protein
MALADVVRKAIGTASKLTTSFQGPLRINRWAGQNALGEDREPTPIVVQAIVNLNPGKTYERDGVKLPIRAAVYVLEPLAPEGTDGRREPIDPRDEFEIPGVPKAFPIGAPGVSDPTTARPYFSEVMIG